MAKRSTKEPVSFSELRTKLESVLALIEQFTNGETLSKNQSEVRLRRYRKELSQLGKLLPGARGYSHVAQDSLVPRSVATKDSLETSTEQSAVDSNVEVPE